jgi:capsular polysaccharide biosynthesis protein
MNRDHDDISGLLIPNHDRVARQSADLSDSYVPFEPPQAPGADSINTESMLGLAAIAAVALVVTVYLIYRYWKSGQMVLALAGAY